MLDAEIRATLGRKEQTAEGAAAELGVSKPTFLLWRRGFLHTLKVSQLRRLARWMGRDPRDLLDMIPEVEDAEDP